MPTRKELKSKALELLKGNFGKAIAIILTMFAISLFFGGLENKSNYVRNSGIILCVLDILEIIIMAFLTAGSTYFFLKISRGEEAKYEDLFNKSDLLWKFVGSELLIGICIFIGMIFLIVPGIIIGLMYSMTPYLLVDDPELGVMGALDKSQRLMKGHKLELFVLKLSFLGWAILSIFTLGLLNLWLIPYMSTTMANYYNALLEEED